MYIKLEAHISEIPDLHADFEIASFKISLCHLFALATLLLFALDWYKHP